MSSQTDAGIPFSISSVQQQFRLLELPSELLTLLSASSPPTLYFKSPDPSTGSSEATLCTPDKTYQLRQVQTSNSVLVACPTTAQIIGSESSQPGLQSISQCSSTLELSSVTAVSALPALKRDLPVYEGVEHANTDIAPTRKSKKEIFADIPLCDLDCEKSWIDLVAFQNEDDSACFQPTKEALLAIWTRLSTEAIARDIDLTSRLHMNDLEELMSSANEWPRRLVEAVFRRLMAGDVQMKVRDIFILDVDPMEELKVDRNTTVYWTGVTLLEQIQDVKKESFLSRWKDLLPENWRADAGLAAIKGRYRLSSDGQSIAYKPLDEAVDSGSAATSKPAAAKSSKRNWHEMFNKSRTK